jgi:hypothetical protein
MAAPYPDPKWPWSGEVMKWSKFEELLAGVACTSLINEALDFEVEALTALERARRSWHKAGVIEGRREENAAQSNANDKRAKPLRGDLSI